MLAQIRRGEAKSSTPIQGAEVRGEDYTTLLPDMLLCEAEGRGVTLTLCILCFLYI